MTGSQAYIDKMVRNITKSTSQYYNIPLEEAARLYLMSSLKQVETFSYRKKTKCSPWDARDCKGDFDPNDCYGPMGPLDPRC